MDLGQFPRSCSKIRYPDCEVADQALRYILDVGTWRKHKPCRSYMCESCGGAHLTHIPLRNYCVPTVQKPSRFSNLPPNVIQQKAKRADQALAKLKTMRAQQIERMNQDKT